MSAIMSAVASAVIMLAVASLMLAATPDSWPAAAVILMSAVMIAVASLMLAVALN